MGTTYTALQNDEGVVLCFSLVIEGYNKIITDHWDTAAMVTAYSGTDWSSVLPGLEIDGTIEQRIRPWGNAPDVPVLRFRIAPDDDDTFGVAIFNTQPASARSGLLKVFRGSTSAVDITVRDATNFSGLSTVYLGRQAMGVSTVNTTTDVVTITANQMGQYAPFKMGTANSNRNPRSAFLPNSYAAGSTAGAAGWTQGKAPYLADTPRNWLGKHIGLYAHRVVDGVIDVKAQAHLVFAGVIKSIGDSMAGTVLECEDLGKGLWRDGVVLRNQYVGRMQEGFYLEEGQTFVVREGDLGKSTTLTVKDSPVGVYQIASGYWTVNELAASMNQWLSDAYQNTAQIARQTSIEIKDTKEGVRTVFSAEGTAGLLAYANTQLSSDAVLAMRHLGWIDYKDNDNIIIWLKSTGVAWTEKSKTEPWRILPRANVGDSLYQRRVVLEPVTGYLVDTRDFLPEDVKGYAGDTFSTSTWALLDVGDGNDRWLARFTGSYGASPGNIDIFTRLNAYSEGEEEDYAGVPITSQAVLEVRQTVILTGTFDEVVGRLVLAVDGDSLNSATYDDIGPGLGVGAPGELFGTNFETSLKAIGEAGENNTMAVIITKPTRLIDILAPEMALRMAWLVFKAGEYLLVSPPVPNPLTADHTLTENNKAGVSGDIDDLRTETIIDTDDMRNTVKIAYGKDLRTGKLVNSVQVIDEPSVTEFGSLPVTIKAENSYTRYSETGPMVEELAANVSARMLPVYGRPLRKYARTVNFNVALAMAPGDSASLTDNFCRNPLTGTRGVANKACTVLSTRVDFGHTTGNFLGECELLFTEEERTFPVSPAAEIDYTYTSGNYTDGYSTTGGYFVKLQQHAYSASGEAKDVTHFEVNDVVDIVEVGDVSGGYQSWTGLTIQSIDTANDIIEVDSALTGYSSTAIYRIRPADFASVTASQQLHSFMSDKATGLVAATDDANLYGEFADRSIVSTKSATVQPVDIQTAWTADGEALDTGILFDLAHNVHHMVSYGQAWNSPIVRAAATAFSSTAGDWRPFLLVPLSNLGGPPSPGLKRQLTIAPIVQSTGSGRINLRITLGVGYPTGDGAVDWVYRGYKVTNSWDITGVAAVAELAAWTVDVPVYGGTALTLFVEGQKHPTGAPGSGNFFGLSKLYLGPLTGVR